jgi:8-oxo-dGTP diphosphatase
MTGTRRAESGETVAVALAVAVRDGRVLVTRRAAGSHLGGLWEFPGGKIGSGEEPSGGAARELTEETGLRGGRIEPLVVVAFDYPDRSVRLHVFLVRDPEGEVVIDGEREWRWADRATLESLEMPEANRPILRALAWRLSS